MPRNQNTNETPASPVWVIGLEYLELSMLNWFVTTQMQPVMVRAVFDHEVRQGLSRERIEAILASGHMLFRTQEPARLQQYYTFFTKNMVKAVRNHSSTIIVQEPNLYSCLTNLEFESRDFEQWEQNGQRVIFTFQSPSNPGSLFGDPQTRIEYGVREDSYNGFVLRALAFPPRVGFAGVGSSVQVTDSWISKPQHVRLPQHVLDSLSYQNRSAAPIQIVSPIYPRFIDKASYILDWLASAGAPKKLDKLNYFDALRLAKEWHEENTRRRYAAMREPVRDDEPLDGVGGIPGRELNVIMGGRMAGRTQTFRGMFDRNRGAVREAGTPRYMQTSVTESDYTLIWERHGWKVYALESQDAFLKESELMRHCIGESPRYWRAKQDDPHHYIAMTLRSPAEPGLGKATATFDYYPSRGFTQLKGENNYPLSMGASDVFVLFLEDIARFGIHYTSPLFNKSEEEYANGTEYPVIRSKHEPEGAIAAVFHGTKETVRNYLAQGISMPESIRVLLHPVTVADLRKLNVPIEDGGFVQVVRTGDNNWRVLEEEAAFRPPVDYPTQEEIIQAVDRLHRARERARILEPNFGTPIQDLIAQDPSPCNEIPLPVGSNVQIRFLDIPREPVYEHIMRVDVPQEQQESRVSRLGQETPPTVVIDTGSTEGITAFNIYRNRGN